MEECKCPKTNGTIEAMPISVQEIVGPAMKKYGSASVSLRDGCTATKEQIEQAPQQMPIIMKNSDGKVINYGIILYCDTCKKFLVPGDRWFGCGHKTACQRCV